MAATSNLTLTPTWVKAVTGTTEDFLASTHETGSVEFAVTATDVTPTLAKGHLLQAGDALTRAVVGTGYVWARKASKFPAQVVLVVTK